MTPLDRRELVIHLRSAGWHAELELRQPKDMRGKPKQFPVPYGKKSRIVEATVFHTEAFNRALRGTFWWRWHVKIYRCADQGDTDLLRACLRRQAQDIHRANAELEGPAKPVSPPWAVVPVHIVRGDRHTETYDGTVMTELEVPLEVIYEQTSLPAWFADDLDVAARTLLAMSPWVDEVQWDDYRDFPGIEHLPDFLHLAKGLDALHRLGAVHCDIKPDNVCRYNVPAASGFVLVDADAATRLDPPPTFVRATPLYSHGLVRRRWPPARPTSDGDRSRQVHGDLDAGVLRAQDRFGFGLVVLSALAGKDWVRNNLLWEGDDGGGRGADHPEKVRAALGRLWSDTAHPQRWDRLIEALAAPFERRIHDPGWSAAAWVGRLLEVTAQPGSRPISRSLPRLSGEDTRRFARELREIQMAASATSANKVDRLWLGFEAVQRQAERLAWRTAWRWAAVPAAVFLIAAAVLVIGAWRGK
jgi:hypothetical protein